MNATVVLIVQDTVAREAAALALEASGLSVLPFEDASSFFSMEEPPGRYCVVADANLTDTWHRLQAEVWRRGTRVPVVFLVKPVDANELCRRVQRLLKAANTMGRLTQREFEVARLASSGVSNEGIAELLSVSFRTVEVHRRNALRKMDTGNPIEVRRKNSNLIN